MTGQCRFCNKTKQKIIYSSELFFVVRDSYPVTKHHTLIIPNRHVSDFFDLNDNELNDLNKILKNKDSHYWIWIKKSQVLMLALTQV